MSAPPTPAIAPERAVPPRGAQVIAVLCGESSPLRTPPYGAVLRPLRERFGVHFTFLAASEADSLAQLLPMLRTLDSAWLTAAEIPPGGSRDALPSAVAFAVLGAKTSGPLLQGPGTTPSDRAFQTQFHAEILEYSDPSGLAEGLAYLIEESQKSGGRPPGDTSDWAEWREAQGLLYRGLLLSRVGGLGDERTAYETLISRFGEREEPAFGEICLKARINLAACLRSLGRPEEALAAYASASSASGRWTDDFALDARARASVLRGELLLEMARTEEARAVLQTAAQELSRSSSEELLAWSDRAELGVGLAHLAQGQAVKALDTFQGLIARTPKVETPPRVEWVAKAMTDRAMTLNDLGRKSEAQAQYDELVQRFGESPEPKVQEETMKARINRGILLGEMGRRRDEVAQYDEVIAILGDGDDPAMQPWLARALLNKGVALGQQRKFRDEVAVYAEVARRFEAADLPALRETAAQALLNEGLALMHLGQDEEAAFALDTVVERYGEESTDSLRSIVQDAREHRARLPEASW